MFIEGEIRAVVKYVSVFLLQIVYFFELTVYSLTVNSVAICNVRHAQLLPGRKSGGLSQRVLPLTDPCPPGSIWFKIVSLLLMPAIGPCIYAHIRSPLPYSFQRTPANVITLGVGWDVLAEQKLKRLLPNVRIITGSDKCKKI